MSVDTLVHVRVPGAGYQVEEACAFAVLSSALLYRLLFYSAKQAFHCSSTSISLPGLGEQQPALKIKKRCCRHATSFAWITLADPTFSRVSTAGPELNEPRNVRKRKSGSTRKEKMLSNGAKECLSIHPLNTFLRPAGLRPMHSVSVQRSKFSDSPAFAILLLTFLG